MRNMEISFDEVQRVSISQETYGDDSDPRHSIYIIVHTGIGSESEEFKISLDRRGEEQPVIAFVGRD